jgi:glycosyltransferase involved in cell wall biosynthesis
VRISYFADIRFPIERANGVQTMETCHALARRGHQVRLVVRPDTAQPPRDPFAFYGLAPLHALRIDRCRVPAWLPARRVAYLAHAVRRIVGARDTDVVLTRDLSLAAAMLRLPASLHPPIVYESHGYAPAVSGELPLIVSGSAPASTAKQRRLTANERRVWRGAGGYVTITAALARELEDRFGPRPALSVVADGARFAPLADPGLRRRAPADAPVVGYAGHLYPWKGVDVLVRALAHLPGVRALVVGGLHMEPDLGRVRRLADEAAPGRVTFTGQVDPPHVAALLRDADVLVLPNTPTRISAAYTSPLKLFEYMASGRPIVASDLPSLREILRPDGNAVLVEPGSPEALAGGIMRVLGDAGLAERLARQAHDDLRGYTWDRRAERLEAVLTGVVGRQA